MQYSNIIKPTIIELPWVPLVGPGFFRYPTAAVEPVLDEEAIQSELDYHTANPMIAHLPTVLIIGLDGFRYTLLNLEEAIDQSVNVNDTVGELIQSLHVEKEALTDLDYYCLGLLEEHCYGNLYREFELMLDYIHQLGLQIYQNIKMHNVYVNGRLPYRYYGIKSNGLYLKREDLFHEELKQELADSNVSITANSTIGPDSRIRHLKIE